MKFQEQNRTIEMNCPVCADTLFQHNEDENSLIICNSCLSEFTRQELKEANSENKQEMIDKAINDVKKQLQKDIKNIFKNSKNFKVK